MLVENGKNASTHPQDDGGDGGDNGNDDGDGGNNDSANLSGSDGREKGSGVAVIVAVVVILIAFGAAAAFVVKKRKHQDQVGQRAATLELTPVNSFAMVENPLRASMSSSSSSLGRAGGSDGGRASGTVGGLSRSGTYLTPVTNNPQYSSSSDGQAARTTTGTNDGYEVAVTRNLQYYASADAGNTVYSQAAPSLGEYAEAALEQTLHTYAEIDDGCARRPRLDAGGYVYDAAASGAGSSSSSSVQYATPLESTGNTNRYERADLHGNGGGASNSSVYATAVDDDSAA